MITNTTVTIQTASDAAQDVTTFTDAATGVVCYRESNPAGARWQPWAVELSRPFMFAFDTLAHRANLRVGGRIVEGSTKYRIVAVAALDAGILDHMEVLADQEQYA